MKPGPLNPDHYRMTVGDHLEELRRRLIFALLGMAVVLVVCLIFGKTVMAYFCAPMIDTLRSYDVSPQLFVKEVGDAFMVWVKIALISAAAIASPWMVYQLWQFIAAGLYPAERKLITRYIPLSISLLIGGMVFVYFVVLPWTLQFFLGFAISVPLPYDAPPSTPVPKIAPVLFDVPQYPGDPPAAAEFQMWFDTLQQRLKFFYRGKVQVIPFGPSNLIGFQFTLPDYIDLVLGMLLIFGLSFQLPLVVLTLERIGIVDVKTLRSSRKLVYFVLVIVACAITPGDAITASVGLTIPLILLYELGIWLARVTPATATETGTE